MENALGSDVFHGVAEELFWLVGVLLWLMASYQAEYGWIVREGLTWRRDLAIDPGGVSNDSEGQSACTRQAHQALAAVTFPWFLYRAWLPTIVTSVNLGFERLDHRRVVHAMLAALRDQYHRVFLSWRSGFANAARLVGLIGLVVLTTTVGKYFFRLPDPPEDSRILLAEVAADDYRHICKLFDGAQSGAQSGASIATLVCKIPGGSTVLHFLYFNLLDIGGRNSGSAVRESHLLFYLFPYAEEWPRLDPGNVRSWTLIDQGTHLRVYHLLLFSFFFVVGRRVIGRLTFLPYMEAVRRMDEVMGSLSSRRTLTARRARWKAADWLDPEPARSG